MDQNSSQFSETEKLVAFLRSQNIPQTKEASGNLPALPKFKSAQISNHRHRENPIFALDLLQDLQNKAQQWLQQLQDVQRQIQDIYLEGPMINGWLESNKGEMSVVDEQIIPPPSIAGHYKLCGLDQEGKLWSKPCPNEQVPQVSLAIARYHRLRSYLNKQQDLEQQIKRFTSALGDVYVQLGLPSRF